MTSKYRTVVMFAIVNTYTTFHTECVGMYITSTGKNLRMSSSNVLVRREGKVSCSNGKFEHSFQPFKAYWLVYVHLL
jgi:hypothetical protein